MTTVEAAAGTGSATVWSRPRLRPEVRLGSGQWRGEKLIHHVKDPVTGDGSTGSGHASTSCSPGWTAPAPWTRSLPSTPPRTSVDSDRRTGSSSSPCCTAGNCSPAHRPRRAGPAHRDRGRGRGEGPARPALGPFPTGRSGRLPRPAGTPAGTAVQLGLRGAGVACRARARRLRGIPGAGPARRVGRRPPPGRGDPRSGGDHLGDHPVARVRTV